MYASEWHPYLRKEICVIGKANRLHCGQNCERNSATLVCFFTNYSISKQVRRYAKRTEMLHKIK